jgi:hypothetical protein
MKTKSSFNSKHEKLKEIEQSLDKEMLDYVRNTKPEQIAKELNSIQPMTQLTKEEWEAIDNSPLLQSFVKRTMRKDE